MDILDRLLGHDAWTTRQLLLRCRELSDQQLDRQFDIAHRSVRATLLHMIRNMEVWTDLIAEQPIRPNEDNLPEGRSIDGLLRRLDVVAADLAAVSTRLQRENKLDECFVAISTNRRAKSRTAAPLCTSLRTACTIGRNCCTCCVCSACKT